MAVSNLTDDDDDDGDDEVDGDDGEEEEDDESPERESTNRTPFEDEPGLDWVWLKLLLLSRNV